MTPLAHIERAARVKVMIFDVDGVLTDGSLTYDANGEITKTFFVLDGLGIQLLNRSGVQTAIISARRSPIVDRRASDLGITHVFQGQHDKRIAFAELLEKTGVTAEECGYIGVAVTVPSGHPDVQYRAHYVTRNPGGRGAVREVCDMVMRAQGTYEQALAPYFG
jgi:3-deoxy-D-manno-octulosonate 8-phosphate phosphatase (KDO 8-P phosphatase)